MAESSKQLPKALLMGVEAAALEAILQHLPLEQLVQVELDLKQLAGQEPVAGPFAVLCGSVPKEIEIPKLAGLLRKLYPDSALYLITPQRTGFERKQLQSCGFTDAFLLPMDNSTFKELFGAEVARARGESAKSYRSVKLVDIMPGTKIDFNTYLYLPANRKHVLFVAAGDEIDDRRAARLAQNNITSLHVEAAEIQKFYDFTARQLKALRSSTEMGETERQARLQGAVRELISGVFSESSCDADTVSGRKVVEDCQQIVKAYILDCGAKSAWYERMLAVAGNEATSYNHQSNVATFAALFSMALGVEEPEDLALAGLLHDIGLANIPFEIQVKPFGERTPEEVKIYQRHAEFSLDIIRDRKMIVSETVLKIVGQHHERQNGLGYPKGKVGKQIFKGAKLLAIADDLDYLTAGKMPGQAALSLVDAMDVIFQRSAFDSPTCEHDPELLKLLMTLFPQRASKAQRIA